MNEPIRFTLAELEAELAAARTRGKAFARPWLDLAALPPLRATDGVELSQAAVRHLCEQQARYKALHAAPAIVHWLRLVDRAHSGTFALALLQQWLASPQDSADRWALVLAGTLGDDRIANVLLPHVQPWCDAARHKLAENAAHAIALLPGDGALLVLDTLRARYRSRFRNVGAAAATAFQAAAVARGLSEDELGDRVLPTFGCDEDARRTFAWDGDAAVAELGPDGKLRWFAADGERKAKGLPKTAPAALQAEVKELQKQLRQTRTAQAQRLEQAMVRQRRWPAARFVELFVQHPFGRSLATGLVFGVYAADGRLQRTCRRYQNGIVADAEGRLEELADDGTTLGLVHPLELTDAQLAAWREHLQRHRAEPLFEQLDRPVLRPDPAHHNRREIQEPRGRTLAAATFRGRAEKRGWQRGSVADAGGVSSYWKEFPGCGLEVVLPIDGMFVGLDPQSPVTLDAACFVRAGSVQRGSYVYDDPKEDDDRRVPFGEVPSIVWSEALGDLRVILGEAKG